MIKPEAAAKAFASIYTGGPGTTYLNQRRDIAQSMQAEFVSILSPADKEKFLTTYYRELGYSEYAGDDGKIFMRGSEKRFVPIAPKKTTKTNAQVSLYWVLL
jgi:hypothetical protein